MIFSDFSRLYKIIKIILSNGLDEFIQNNKSTIKIKKFRPASSEFSVFKGTGKINPFDAISKK